MSEKYIMTTEEVRERFVQPQSQSEALDPDAHYVMGEAFDTWLDSIRSGVWDDGVIHGHNSEGRLVDKRSENPYGKE